MDENKVELLENMEKQETNLPVPVENTEKPIEDKKPKKKGGRSCKTGAFERAKKT